MNETVDLQVFDLTQFRERMMEDEDLMRDVIQAMLEDTPLQIEALRQSIASGDCEGSGKIGHRIKGGAANICCRNFELIALKIELAGKAGKVDELGSLISELEKSWKTLQTILGNLWQ